MEEEQASARPVGGYFDADENADDWRRGDGRGRRRGRRPAEGPGLAKILLVLAALALGFVVCLAGFAFYLYSSARARLFDGDPSAQGAVVFTVNSGDTFNAVLGRLQTAGLLRKSTFLDDRTLILLYREWSDEPFTLRAGTVKIERSASLTGILQALQSGGSREFSLTVPEGKTVEETAALAKRKQPDFDSERFVALTRDPDFVRKMGVDEATLEGYLYPSTYDFPPGTKPEGLIESMVRGFRRAMSEANRSTPNSTGRPLRDIVIIASLVEREARSDADRPLIAGVIENRLNRNMRLQIDATVNYALGSWRRLTFADYKFESNYNTYLHDGLPPGPICSPGLASIKAALDPTESAYLFYVHKGDGHHAFAETYEEHLANVRAYIRNDPEALRLVEQVAVDPVLRQSAPVAAGAVDGAAPAEDSASGSGSAPQRAGQIIIEPADAPGAPPRGPRQY